MRDQHDDHDRVPGPGDAHAEDRRQAVVGDAAGAAGHVAAFVEHHDEELRERERHQREIEALEPGGRDRRPRARSPRRPGRRASDRERQRHAELEKQDHHGVGADAVEREVRERDLPGDAEQEVVAERERDPEEQLAVDVVVVAAQEERAASRDHERRGDPHRRAVAFLVFIRARAAGRSAAPGERASGTAAARPAHSRQEAARSAR